MTESYVQPALAFEPSERATARLAAGHQLNATLINADPDEVVMAQPTCSHLYTLARALMLRNRAQPGRGVKSALRGSRRTDKAI